MERITSILDKKEAHFHTVSPEASAENALSQMCCENVDHLVVVENSDSFVGLITEQDILRKVLYAHLPMDKTKVKSFMHERLPVVTTEDTVERCMQIMQQHNCRYLPVFENFKFRGIVSSDDILAEAVENRSKIFDSELKGTHSFGVFT